jgi:hypothetical protein
VPFSSSVGRTTSVASPGLGCLSLGLNPDQSLAQGSWDPLYDLIGFVVVLLYLHKFCAILIDFILGTLNQSRHLASLSILMESIE